MNTFWTIALAIISSSGVSALVQFFVKRYDEKKGKKSAVMAALDKLGKKVDYLGDELAEDRATNARIRILDFSDEVRHGERHSKEAFDQINLDIDTYRRYCDDHKDYQNNRAVMAITNIERVYAKCLEANDFLV